MALAVIGLFLENLKERTKMRRAVVRESDGLIVNVVEYEEGSSWQPPLGCYLLDAEHSQQADIGDMWDGTQLINPTPPPPPEPVIPTSTHWAIVDGFDLSSEKPLIVKRTLGDTEIVVSCYVTKSVVDLYQAGLIKKGDFVLVDFVDDNVNKPLAVDKIYKTW